MKIVVIADLAEIGKAKSLPTKETHSTGARSGQAWNTKGGGNQRPSGAIRG